MSIPTSILLVLPLGLMACESTTAPADAGAGRLPQVSTSAGLTRTMWPSPEDPGPPYYARIEPTAPHIPVVDGWAVVVFYRDPGCIPTAFNLLRLFNPPAAFGCRLTVAGFNLWSGEPFGSPPMMAQARGTGAVPVWFVPADAALGAVEDGVLTIEELAGLSGRLVGSATRFEEMLQPFEGAAPTPKLTLDAGGTLADGRAFHYHITTVRDEVGAIELHFE